MNQKRFYEFLICDKQTGDVIGYFYTRDINKAPKYKSKKFFLHFSALDVAREYRTFKDTKFNSRWKLNICQKVPEA